MTLYPYNQYVLWFAVIMVTVFLINLLLHLKRFDKTVRQMKKEKTDVIQKRMMYLQMLRNSLDDERARRKAKQNKFLKALMPLLFAALLTYRKDETLHGVKGYVKAARSALLRKQKQKQLSDAFRSLF